MKNRNKAFILLGFLMVSVLVAIFFNSPGETGCGIYDQYLEKVYYNTGTIQQNELNKEFIYQSGTECNGDNGGSEIIAKYYLKYDINKSRLTRDKKIETLLRVGVLLTLKRGV